MSAAWSGLPLLALLCLAAPGPTAAQQQNATAAPAELSCACSLTFSYADPKRYQYWRREQVDAGLTLRLADGEGTYRAAAFEDLSLCDDVREERKGDPFRSVDMCIEMGQWLKRIQEEARCSVSDAADGGTAAECRLPDPDPDAREAFLTAGATAADHATALCNAFAHMAELRLAADIVAFETDNLHGLPDLRHNHSCVPK